MIASKFHKVGILTLVLTIVGVNLLATASNSFADSCDIRIERCDAAVTAGNDGHEVTLESGSTSSGGARDAGPLPAGRATAPSEPAPAPYLGRPTYSVTAPVTLSDLARFRPDPGTDHMQPNGWMIVGLSTNFYARAEQQIKVGTLLGRPASVRFTPARYAWTYGDGSTRSATTPGGTWSSLGINEFDATPTSHIYRNSGRYFIDLTIGFTPEYRYATSTEWIPVAGYVWVPANRLEAVASQGAKTVLVQDECTKNPAGPGC